MTREWIALPAYSELVDLPSSPSYSQLARSSENVSSPRLPLIRDQNGQQTHSRDFVQECSGLRVQLGHCIWRIKMPVYGLNGEVEGSARLDPTCTHVVKITAKLKGNVRTSAMERGVLTGIIDTRILSRASVLFSSSSDYSVYDRPLSFSFPIPTYIDGGMSPLPPSSMFHHPGVTCEVNYALHIRVHRKGLRRSKSLEIPILYLPKSRPQHPQLMEVPPSISHSEDRIKTIRVSPFWTRNTCTRNLVEEGLPSVSLSLPYPLSFTAGELIPLLLNITCPATPALTKLLAPNIDIQLIKRSIIWVKAGSNRLSGLGKYVSTRGTSCAKAVACHVDDAREGIHLLQYKLKAGVSGAEMSWSVPEVVGVMYSIEVNIQPSKITGRHLPSYRCEVPVQLTTDHWGTLNTELLVMDGVPLPALALATDRLGSLKI